MAIQRSSIKRGPAIIQIGGQSIYTQGDIKVAIAQETFAIATSLYGKTGERLSDIGIKLSFTPSGMWSTGLLAVTHPHGTPVIGSSLGGASDVSCILHPTNGTEKMTFSAALVSKMPNLKFSATDPLMREMEITCILKNNTDRSNAAALFAIADEAFSDTSFDLGLIYTVPYTVSLSSSSSPWTGIETEAGVDVEFDLKTSPVKVNTLGLVDYTLAGLDVSVKLKPIGMTVADVLTQMKLQGSGVAIGQEIGASVNTLTITGGSGKPQAIVYNVRLKNGGQMYGNEALRHDTIEFVATRPTGGAMFALGLAS
jgi:hypothetical protein